MKIAFVTFGYENLGVEYLSASLKKEGHSVSLVFDPALFNTYHVNNRPLSNLFTFRNLVIRKIIKIDPDIVAFSVLSDNYSWAKDIAAELKRNKKGVIILFGGIHPTSVPEFVINEDFIDYVCVGEGEEALVELARALEENNDTTHIKNIWVKKEKNIFRNEPRELIGNLDKLPLPDKNLFYSEYPGFTSNIYMTMTSRGCPYRCTYCYNSYLMDLYKDKGKYLRRFSVDRVIEELSIAKEKYRMKRVVFVDDVFTSNEQWLEDFVYKYRKNIDVPFGCLVHPLFVNHNIVRLLKEARCTVVGMGIQTLNETIKKGIVGRNEDNDIVRDAISLFKKEGVFIYVDFIFGLPEESKKDAEAAALFLAKTHPDAVATLWLRYYPKAEIINIAKERGMLSGKEILDINQAVCAAPVSDFGNSKSTIDKRLISFVLISADMPAGIIRFFLKHNIYKLLPQKNMHHLHTFIKQLLNKINKKDGSLYSSFVGLLRYYRTYITRYLLNKINNAY